MDNLNDKLSNEAQNQPSCLGVVSGNYIPQSGDLFEWCDEKFWCISSGSFSGVVNPVGETFYQRGFIWNYGGEKPIFIKKGNKDELERLGLANCH